MTSIRQTASFLSRTSFLFRQTPARGSTPLADLILSRQSQVQLRRLHIHSSPLRRTVPRNATRRHFTTSRRLPDSSKAPHFDPTPNLNSPKESLSFTQRLKKLSREYGWAAFGVYAVLTALDLPLCFLAVRSIGTEKVGEWEHIVVEWVKRAIPVQIPEKYKIWKKEPHTAEVGGIVGDGIEKMEKVTEDTVTGYDHGVREAEELNKGDSASFWTQLALAYAIHKTFIFIRVPITAAITPKVVKTLRGWGWNIGKRRPKAERMAAKEARKAATAGAK